MIWKKDAKMNDNILWLNKLVPKHILLKESEIEGKLSPLNITSCVLYTSDAADE